jgi:hypothetical protein
LWKTADGALLYLDYTINVNSDVHVSIASMTGEIAFCGGRSPALQLGIAIDPDCHVIDTGHQFAGGAVNSLIKGQLRLPLTRAALEAIEHVRQGNTPKFEVGLHASAFVKTKEAGPLDLCRVDFADPGPIEIEVQRDSWQTELQKVSPMGSVLIEIPVSFSRAAPWDRVWRGLDAAAINLAQGGEVAYKNCVSEVRQALDCWKEIDGFGSKQRLDRQQSKRERLQAAASALYHFCSLSVHADEHQVDWTRSDAILAISTLCSLLAVRDPWATTVKSIY